MKFCHVVKIALTLAVCVLISVSLNAQSGRKLPKGSPPVAAPTPEPEIVTTPKIPPKPDFLIKFVSDIPRAGPTGFISPERLHTWTVERLRRSTLLDVRDSGSLNRRDAIKLAKEQTESFVVLIELHNDIFSGSNARASTVVLTIYNPGTGKVKQTRSLSIGQNSTRLPGSTNVLYSCYPGVYGDQLLLLEASIEAADTIFRSFNVPLPPICGGKGI